MKKITPSIQGKYNIFGYTKWKARALTCFTNGAKVHDHFLKKYITRSEDEKISPENWKEYKGKAGEPILSDDENLMLPYLFNESVPVSKEGIIRQGFGEDDGPTNIRALHISQSLALKLHSSHLDRIDNICIVGGSAKNSFLRQIITDVFNAPSYSIKNADFAAPIGCAISGARRILKTSYKKAAEMFVQKDESTALKPVEQSTSRVKYLIEQYSLLEEDHTEDQ
jgi:sugar (pentulose or hexulose) kinase